MMKIITLIHFMFFSFIIHAQSECFPINEGTGKVEIKGKVIKDGLSKDQLFTKAVVWGTSKASYDYKAKDKNVEQFLKDKDAGVFKFYTQIMYDYKDGFRTVYFAITFLARDGYFEYTVNDFNMNKKPMEIYLTLKEGESEYKLAFQNICKKLNYILGDMKELKEN